MLVALRGAHGFAPAPRRSLALLDSAEHFMNEMRYYVSIHSRPIRRLTPQPTERGRADCPSLKGGAAKKDFIGFAVLSTPFFPLKGEVSNHKGIFDEHIKTFFLFKNFS